MLKPVKRDVLNIFIAETSLIKESIINLFNFKEIECDYPLVSFWVTSVINVTKMMLFVS